MKVLALIFLSAISFIGNAQKLPNTQSASLKIPVDVKIDGRAAEWGDKFQAYNKATQLDYTLANDADNLYLAVRCQDIGVTSKILAGGIILNIDPSNKKNANGASIIFPHTNSGWTNSEFGTFKPNFKVATDSVIAKAIVKNVKLFRVNNFVGLGDTVLSIYNETGIQAKMLFLVNSLFCEMLIPKKFVRLVGFSGPFAYQVKLPGVPSNFPAGGNPDRSPTHPLNILYGLSATTDFWGEYTLAK